jgi:hypothetical protein
MPETASTQLRPLQAEYTRKMAYNKTRPHRHGGKRA